MLLPGPGVSHGSLYAPLPLLLSPSPQSAMCHFQVSSHCWCPGPLFCHGCWQITGLPCCCQARNLPWAPVPPPHAAARSECVSWVPVRPPIAAVSIATLCHVPLSGLLTHTAGGSFC
ncbi:unnamed protein product, partial [Staurois parvus]